TSAWCAGPLRLAANGASEPGTLPRLRARPEPGPHESGGCRVFGVYADLGAPGAVFELVIGGYLIAFAVLLITGARLGQTHGYRRLYLTGMAVFTLASLVCGLAGNAIVLIAARVLQGGGAALMFPQTLTGIQLSFAGAERARAIGLYAIALSSG